MTRSLPHFGKLPDLKPEDILKLHNEVNQYINHRFFITTTAITITGVVLGWIAAKDPSSLGDLKAFFIVLSLLIILGALYATSQIINRSISVLTSYLCVRRLSRWEMLYKQLRDEGKLKWAGQDESLRIVFGILGLLAGFMPFILWLVQPNHTLFGLFELILGHTGVNQEIMLGAVFLLIAILLYEIFIVFGIGSMVVGFIIFLLVHSLSIFIPLSLGITLLIELLLLILALSVYARFRQKLDFNEESMTKWLELEEKIQSTDYSEPDTQANLSSSRSSIVAQESSTGRN